MPLYRIIYNIKKEYSEAALQSSCYWVYSVGHMTRVAVCVYANHDAQRVMAGGTVINGGWLCNHCSS